MNEKLLLLSCCAPCSCAVIEKLAREGRPRPWFFTIRISARLRNIGAAAMKTRGCAKYTACRLLNSNMIIPRWCELTAGLENEPERGRRCDICFYMRLKRVMEYAAANGYTAVASVLGVSRYKDLEQVNRAAAAASAAVGIPYLEIEGRKGGMQDRRAELIKRLELYNQTYCGCKPRPEN